MSLNKEYDLAYKALGNLFFDQHDYTAALENYKAYISYAKDDINSYEFYYNKGYAENELEKFSDAIESLNKAIEIKNEEPRSFDELGYAYYKLDDADNAIKYYNSSIALKADSHVPYVGLGDVYKDLKKNT